mgnify:CR=1 FL=1
MSAVESSRTSTLTESSTAVSLMKARIFTASFTREMISPTRAIIDAVKPARAKFCYEMMGWAIPDSADRYLKLIKAVDRPAFGVHLDPRLGSNLCAGGGTVECYAILRNRIAKNQMRFVPALPPDDDVIVPDRHGAVEKPCLRHDEGGQQFLGARRLPNLIREAIELCLEAGESEIAGPPLDFVGIQRVTIAA